MDIYWITEWNLDSQIGTDRRKLDGVFCDIQKISLASRRVLTAPTIKAPAVKDMTRASFERTVCGVASQRTVEFLIQCSNFCRQITFKKQTAIKWAGSCHSCSITHKYYICTRSSPSIPIKKGIITCRRRWMLNEVGCERGWTGFNWLNVRFGMDSSEHDSHSVKRWEFLYQLSNYQLRENDSAIRSQLRTLQKSQFVSDYVTRTLTTEHLTKIFHLDLCALTVSLRNWLCGSTAVLDKLEAKPFT
jgi:hypothetical protein